MHELHVRKLNQHKSLASARVCTTENSLSGTMDLAHTARECFHAYGVESITLEPELVRHESGKTSIAH